jgi:hypothetical protein
MKKEPNNAVKSSEELDQWLNTLDWKEIKKNPKLDQYPSKILSYKGFQVFAHREDTDKFLIRNGEFKKFIDSYQNTSIAVRKGDIVFFGWDDNIYFDTEKRRIKTQHIR